MSIVVHIDRLILDGVPLESLDRSTLDTAVRQELTRLLTASGLDPALAAGGARPSLRGGEIATPASGPHALGTQIATAIHAGIGSRKGGTR